MLILSFPFAYAEEPSVPEIVFEERLVPSIDSIPSLERKILTQGDCSHLDLLFLYDGTGSMGFYLMQAQAHGIVLLDAVQKMYSDSRFAVAVVRDYAPFGSFERPYELVSPFSSEGFLAFSALESITAFGGGDMPEAYPYALRRASNESWREEARRFVFLVADSYSRNKDLLQESIQHSNFELIVLASDLAVGEYWKNYTPSVFVLSPQETFDRTVLQALETGCSQHSPKKDLAFLH